MSFSLCHVLNIFDIEHKRDLIVSYSLPGVLLSSPHTEHHYPTAT